MPMSKEYHREYSKKHYQENRAAYYAKNEKAKAEKTQWLREYKESRGCADCGVMFPFYMLDFDHLPGVDKKYNVSRMANIGSWTKLKEEVAKCEVVCANCHRKRTYERGHITE